ncbi:MAG: polysaccharide deacetylase family protein [Reyranellaceae bacterium]
MPSWPALRDEARRWQEAGRVADLWWRDDDAAETDPALDRLLALRDRVGAPLALAVVPARATEALAAGLAGQPDLDILQHGYGHQNHAPPVEKRCELGPHRPAMVVLGELGTGWLALERLFGARALPVLVPPWNRIAPGLVPTLPEIGYHGLSTFGPRRVRRLPALIEINAHVDVIDWKGGRGFVGVDVAVTALVRALSHAREISAEPVGLLSHHLAMDAQSWDFLESVCEMIQNTPGLRLRPARELFAAPMQPPGEGKG